MTIWHGLVLVLVILGFFWVLAYGAYLVYLALHQLFGPPDDRADGPG